MKKRYFIFAILILISISGSAQNYVSGIVTDKNNGEPLIGVNVQINEISKGAITNNNGSYNIDDLPNGELIIQFSYVGFKTTYKKIFISGKNILLDIAMDIMVIEGQEVVISGNFTSTQHDNTVKISTISAMELSQSIAPSLIEAIAEVPGVDFISKGPGIGTPVIRGLSLSNILFLNNGVPMKNYQFSANHPYMIDENGVERIEIIKGPASLIYGSGAVGGVINLIGEPIAKNGTIEGDVVIKYFGNTSGIESNIGIKGNKNGFFWGLRGGLNSNKDYIQGDGKFAPNTRFNRNNIKIVTGLITKKASFKIIYQYNEDKLGLAVEPAITLVTTNNRINEVWYQSLKNHFIISQNKLFLGNLKLELDLSYQNNNRQLFGSELTPVFMLVDMTLQTFSYRLKSTYSVNEDFKVIVGVQGMFQNNKNYDAPDHVIPDANIWDISFYGLGQYNFGDKVILEAGMRFSHKNIYVPLQEVSDHDHKKTQLADEDFIEFNGNYNNLSVSIGSTIKFTEQLLLRLNLASAFRSPNIAELTQNGMHGTRFELGNPDLVTQRNTEADIGFHIHTTHTSFDLSAFYNNVDNYIYLSPTTDTTSHGELIYMYKQTPSFLYGGEALIHLHPHPIHWLHIKASYSYVIGKQQSGDYLPFIPAQRLKFEFKTTKNKFHIFKNIYLLAGIQFILPQNQPSPFELSSPGYSLINIGFGTNVKFNNQVVSFNVNVSNLLDVEYIDHLSTLRELNIMDMGRSINFRISLPFSILK
ncbi:MAG: TonB-dependent receptor [Bacteroidota bacterium]